MYSKLTRFRYEKRERLGIIGTASTATGPCGGKLDLFVIYAEKQPFLLPLQLSSFMFLIVHLWVNFKKMGFSQSKVTMDERRSFVDRRDKIDR